MCNEVAHEDDTFYGELWDLCQDPECDDFLAHLSFGSAHDVAEAVAEQFAARVAVVEYYYFDSDFRSEFTAVHETRFSATSLDVWRIHFFDGDGPEPDSHIRDWVAAQPADAYLGYMTRRPDSPSSVGRSMTFPGRVNLRFEDPTSVQRHVRTFVTEHVNLFGVPLQCTGVPFMEGDGHLLRCGHVTVWMAHYATVLRGWTGRRTSASFAGEHEVADAHGRAYPARGISPLAQTHVLRRAGLPPEVVDFSQFEDEWDLDWYDRPGLESDAEVNDSAFLEESVAAAVVPYLNSGIPCILNTEQHSVLLCGYFRYRDLGDGGRVVEDAEAELGDDDQDDQNDGASLDDQDDAGSQDDQGGPAPAGTSPDGTGIAGFIAQDSDHGPFRVIQVAEIVRRGLADEHVSLCVPLPGGLWLNGGLAQHFGALIVASLVEQTLQLRSKDEDEDAPVGDDDQPRNKEPSDAGNGDELTAASGEPNDPARDGKSRGVGDLCGARDDPGAGHETSEGIDEVDWLRDLSDAIDVGRPGDFFLRVYAQQGTDFKTSFTQRLDDTVAARVVGYTFMPKYVWVIEVLSRTLHGEKQDPVVATVVLDGSDGTSEITRLPTTLLVHLPGHISQLMPDVYIDSTWKPCRSTPYASGRWWNDGRVHADDDAAVARRHKSAQ